MNPLPLFLLSFPYFHPMLYPLKSYLWPDECPRCHKKMGLLDKVVRMMTTVANVVTFASGKGGGEKTSDPRKCDFCGKSSGAR